MLRCEFEDANLVTHDVMVDVCAPIFGLYVKARVMAGPHSVFQAADIDGR